MNGSEDQAENTGEEAKVAAENGTNGSEDQAENTGEEAKVAAADGGGGNGSGDSGGNGGGDSLAELAGTFKQGGDFYGQLGRLIPASQGLSPDQQNFISQYYATARKLDGPMDDYERLPMAFPEPTWHFVWMGGFILIVMSHCQPRDKEPMTKVTIRESTGAKWPGEIPVVPVVRWGTDTYRCQTMVPVQLPKGFRGRLALVNVQLRGNRLLPELISPDELIVP